jgi:hypothetical protein
MAGYVIHYLRAIRKRHDASQCDADDEAGEQQRQRDRREHGQRWATLHRPAGGPVRIQR